MTKLESGGLLEFCRKVFITLRTLRPLLDLNSNRNVVINYLVFSIQLAKSISSKGIHKL